MVGGSVLGTRRLLIAGDVALSRSLIDMVLSRLGYTVTCVACGQQALEAVDHTRFALALVSMRLPDLPGLELARRMRGKHRPGNSMPIVLFGEVRESAAMLATCREVGLQGFLPKPISIGRLISSVCGIVRTTASAGSRFMTVSGHEPLQLDRLREFTDGDEQLERELVSLFLSTAGLYLDELRDRLDEPAVWRRSAHALKGASANIGASRLQLLAEEAERAGPASDRLADLDDALDEIRRHFLDRWATDQPPERRPRPVELGY